MPQLGETVTEGTITRWLKQVGERAAVAEEARRTDGGAPLTSPNVRRLVAERGLDPASITGSGPGGRVTRRDVLDRAAGVAPSPPPAPAAPAPSPAPPPPQAPPPPAP